MRHRHVRRLTVIKIDTARAPNRWAGLNDKYKPGLKVAATVEPGRFFSFGPAHRCTWRSLPRLSTSLLTDVSPPCSPRFEPTRLADLATLIKLLRAFKEQHRDRVRCAFSTGRHDTMPLSAVRAQQFVTRFEAGRIHGSTIRCACDSPGHANCEGPARTPRRSASDRARVAAARLSPGRFTHPSRQTSVVPRHFPFKQCAARPSDSHRSSEHHLQSAALCAASRSR